MKTASLLMRTCAAKDKVATCRGWAGAFVRLGVGLAWLGGPVRAAVVNPGFDQGTDGLHGWAVSGTVFTTGQQAVLSDQGAVHSLLWQAMTGVAGIYRLDFDLRLVLGAGGWRRQWRVARCGVCEYLCVCQCHGVSAGRLREFQQCGGSGEF